MAEDRDDENPLEDGPRTVEADPVPNERLFLEGPRSRWKELVSVLGIMREFIRGFRTLHFVGPCVTVFGSARFPKQPVLRAHAERSATRSRSSGSRS